jgi:CYTH domain-containing protein
MAKISERLESFGHRVFRVPETATMLLLGGMSLADLSAIQMRDLQAALLRQIQETENTFIELSKIYDGEKPSVILCDRGLMDVRAYVTQEIWDALTPTFGGVIAMRDSRYEAVIHMVTAADGAESAYTLSNNEARYETAEEARGADKRTQDAWVGHPHLRIIDNSTGFDQKVQRAIQTICRVVGIPDPVERERRFLVKNSGTELPIHSVEVEIEQTYLLDEEGRQSRVRRRGVHGSYVYTHTSKIPMSPGESVEIERTIDPREYLALLAQRDPQRQTLRKRRRCFVYEGHYFELDTFKDRLEGKQILEVEVNELDEPVELPPFVDIEQEVTGELKWSNWSLALDTLIISRLTVDVPSKDRPGHTHVAGTEIAPVRRAGEGRWFVEIRTPENGDYWYEQVEIGPDDSEVVEVPRKELE